MLKQTITAGASIAALVLAATPGAQAQRLEGARADIHPFGGTITQYHVSTAPFQGSYVPGFGSINPFFAHKSNTQFGDINPFWGDINPFWGDINPFMEADAFGDINPFWGNSAFGDINPWWGDINPFMSGDINPFTGKGLSFGDINPFWEKTGKNFGRMTEQMDMGRFGQALDELDTIYDDAKKTWSKQVKDMTGEDFHHDVWSPLMQRHGINLWSEGALANLDAAERSTFFLDMYDTLMAYSGVDRVDHWMATANWSPLITQVQGDGYHAHIGVLDSAVHLNREGDYGRYTLSGGSRHNRAGEHGAGVLSLIAGAHDGSGTMGIAPRAQVSLQNPFADDGTADWNSVRIGVNRLVDRGADIVNLSLGVPGWTLHSGWSNVLSSGNRSAKDQTLFIKAAGNDGITQGGTVNWYTTQPDNLIVVGSVNPNGVISNFSNRPGNTQLRYGNQSTELMYRFMVAPGEMILVDDGQGGTVRRSGTSYSAPLVSGAAALIMDRWPWLNDRPDVVSDILLRSARDLGAPGVDPVYGWGLLDVEASQSPLDFDTLTYYAPRSNRASHNGHSLNDMYQSNWRSVKSSMTRASTLRIFETLGWFYVGFEKHDGGTVNRDFAIPLSSKTVNDTYWSQSDGQKFQSYITSRLEDWAHGRSSNLTDQEVHSANMGQMFGFDVSALASERALSEASGEHIYDAAVKFAHPTGKLAFIAGSGDLGPFGRITSGGRSAFGFASDTDLEVGGVNPVLGIAEGGSFAGLTVSPTNRLGFGVSMSHTDVDNVAYLANGGENGETAQNFVLPGVDATAAVIDARFSVSENARITASYTALQENGAILGATGTGFLAMPETGFTNAFTVGVDMGLPFGFDVSASATQAQTTATDDGSSVFALGDEGLTSTAFAMAALKTGVFGENDRVRFSIAQPLHVESGEMSYTSVQVIDRTTGEIGTVTETGSLAEEYRPIALEALYAAGLFDGMAEVNLFATSRIRDEKLLNVEQDFALGGAFKVSF